MVSSIILIILDTLRKDYGEKYLTPMLKEWGFIYYPNAIAPSPWTIPTHVSIFTGKYPSIHGIHETDKLKIPNIRIRKISKEFLPIKLSDSGYHTLLISANALIQPDFGFKGFRETYNTFWAPSRRLSHHELDIINKYSNSKRFKYTMAAVNLIFHGELNILWDALLDSLWYTGILPFLKRYPLEKGITKTISILKSARLHDKNFVFINLMEAHEPYSMKYPTEGGIILTLTGKVTESLINNWQLGYKRATSYLANKLRIILNRLKEKINFDNSLIIITSDHGQLLGEGGRIGHGVFLDDELIKVPLWIRYPNHLGIPISKDGSNKGYIPLTSLYSLIINSLHEDITPITPVETAFSESFGIPNQIHPNRVPEHMLQYYENFERHRIAVYHGDFKGIFNTSEGKFDEIRSLKHTAKVPSNVKRDLEAVVESYLKTASIAKVPRITL